MASSDFRLSLSNLSLFRRKVGGSKFKVAGFFSRLPALNENPEGMIFYSILTSQQRTMDKPKPNKVDMVQEEGGVGGRDVILDHHPLKEEVIVIVT